MSRIKKLALQNNNNDMNIQKFDIMEIIFYVYEYIRYLFSRIKTYKFYLFIFFK